ncbi:MAG: hypothetical protein JWQ35_2450 [Bacteriovoracaceae bacterium]|nr:hypothetical protein [Bacteriovoracaceae bacterium]
MSRTHDVRASWILTFLLLSFVFLAAFCLIIEADIPWYLSAGEEMLKTKTLLLNDPFSYTSELPWINHEWLMEILLALIYRGAGDGGLSIFQGFIFIAIALVFLKMRSQAALDGVSFLGIISAFIILREFVSPRAQLLSNLFFVLSIWIVFLSIKRESSDQKKREPLLLIIPLGFLWTQFHGGNPHLFILMFLLWLSRPSWKRAAFTVVAALLTCMGPNGFQVHDHLFRSFPMMGEISEWQPIYYVLKNIPILFSCLILLFVFSALVSLIRRRSANDKTYRFEALVFAFFLLATMKYSRFLNELMLVSTIVLLPLLEKIKIDRKYIFASCFGVILLGALFSSRTMGIGFSPHFFPIEAVQFLKQNHLKGPLFNSYNFGGYLMWEYPEEKVFIDSRAFTVYDGRQIAELVNVYSHPQEFQILDDQYHFELAVLQQRGRGKKLIEWLKQRPNWNVVFEDEIAVILIKKKIQNKP